MARRGACSQWGDVLGGCCRGCWRAGLPVALGLDLPLGLPRELAAARPEAGFSAFLRGLADTPDFFRVSAGLETSPRPGPSTRPVVSPG